MGIGLGVSGLTFSEHESSKVYDGLYQGFSAINKNKNSSLGDGLDVKLEEMLGKQNS